MVIDICTILIVFSSDTPLNILDKTSPMIIHKVKFMQTRNEKSEVNQTKGSSRRSIIIMHEGGFRVMTPGYVM